MAVGGEGRRAGEEGHGGEEELHRLAHCFLVSSACTSAMLRYRSRDVLASSFNIQAREVNKHQARRLRARSSPPKLFARSISARRRRRRHHPLLCTATSFFLSFLSADVPKYLAISSDIIQSSYVTLVSLVKHSPIFATQHGDQRSTSPARLERKPLPSPIIECTSPRGP